MSEKPVAIMVALLAVAPICALCILGPAIIGVFFAGALGWVTDMSTGSIVILAIVAVVVVIGLMKLRVRQRLKTDVPNSRYLP